MATILGMSGCKRCGLGSTNVATIEYLLQIYCANATKKEPWPKGLNAALVKLREAIHAELMNIVSNPYGMTDAEINAATELLSATASKGNVKTICALYTKFEIDSVISRNYADKAKTAAALNEVNKALKEVAPILEKKEEIVEVIDESKKVPEPDKKQPPSPPVPTPPPAAPTKGMPWGAILGAGAAAVGAWLLLKD